ncbi:MAG: hypothetical protein WDO73_05650 [Ignavibacteriota bacterium]
MTSQAPGTKDDILTSAAKAIGTAAGKIASLTGVAESAATPHQSHKVGKLQKKNKPHLPRRMKKRRKRPFWQRPDRYKASNFQI